MFGDKQDQFSFLLLVIHLIYTLSAKSPRNYEENKKESHALCEFDPNLLGEIMGRLCLSDQARFRAVCNNWSAVRPINTTRSSFPWYVKFDRSIASDKNMLEFRLYDPLSSLNSPSVYYVLLTDLGIPAPSSWGHIGASRKNNWLFFGISKPSLHSLTSRYFFVFSPFSKQIIKLPQLDYPSRFKFRRTFSHDPRCKHCIFFLADTYDMQKIVIITSRSGDKKWTAREFDRDASFIPCDACPIYFRDTLCLVSPFGQLASYDIVDDKFKFENLLIDECFALNYNSSRVNRVFELNGELMLVYFGSKKKKIETSQGKQCIKRYDWSNKVWIPVSTLGGKTLFVSDHILSVATINAESTRNGGVLSNKIYRFFDCGCIIYSLKDGDLVEFKSFNSKLLDDGGDDLPQINYNCGITFWDMTKAIYWLEPPDVLKKRHQDIGDLMCCRGPAH